MWSTIKSVFEPLTQQTSVLSSLAESVSNHRTLAVVTAASASFLLYGSWFLKRPRNLPPGPYGYPIVGCLPYFESAVKNKFRDLTERYGDVFSIWFGGNRYVVILNSYDTIKEVYVNSGSKFMDRDGEAMTNMFGVGDTIFNAHFDESHKESRKIATQRLRTVISNRLGNIMAAELREMEKFLDCHLEEAIDVSQWLRRVFINNITQVMYSKRYSDKDADTLAGLFQSWNECFGEAFLSYLLLPWYISSTLSSKSLLLGRSVAKDLFAYVRNNVSHRASLQENGSLQDVLDAYLQGGRYTEDQIVATLFTLMPSATSPNMTLWVLLYLVNHPEYQDDIYNEIKDAFEHEVDLSLRSQMPVTESFIMEVFRIVTPISFAVPNRPMTTTSLRGYNIPDFVTIMARIETVHQDPHLFPEPEKFKPRRFIKDGKIGNIQGFMPFGVGRRMCIGEQLIRNNIFYIVTRLMLKYRIYSPDGAPLSTEFESIKFIKKPKKFFLSFKNRSN